MALATLTDKWIGKCTLKLSRTDRGQRELILGDRQTGKTATAIGAVVFGSDQELVGQFNDVIAEFAISKLAALPGKPQLWAVGERIHARLADAGLPLVGLFAVPNSVKAITPLVGQILLESEARRGPSATLRAGRDAISELHLFYNRPRSGAVYRAPASTILIAALPQRS